MSRTSGSVGSDFTISGLSRSPISSTSTMLAARLMRYLGRKGKLKVLLRDLGRVSAAERPGVGKRVNAVSADVQAAFEAPVRVEHASAGAPGQIGVGRDQQRGRQAQ